MISHSNGLYVNTPVIITLRSSHSIGDASARLAAAVNPAATLTANRAYYWPFIVHNSISIDRLFVSNGTTVSGNIDLGIYNYSGTTKLVSTGSTAQSGTSQWQVVSVTATPLLPGGYFFGFAIDNATGTVERWNYGDEQLLCMVGAYSENSAFPLPSSMTPAITTNIYLPFTGCFQAGF